MNFRKNLKADSAITLIALVITIIVLLILAAVSLNLVAGGDGILGKVGTAVDETNIAQIAEEVELAMAELKTDFYEEKYVNRNNQIPSNFEDYAAEALSGENGVKTANGTLKLVGTTVTYENEKTGEVAEGEFNPSTATITNIKTPAEKNSDGGTQNPDDSGESGETGGTTVTIPEGLEIGSEVSYTPSGTYTEWTTEHSGYDTSYKLASGSSYNADDASLTNMTISEWKVFKINEATGEVQLVPKENPTATVGLKGADGYNNAVKLLDDACSSLYGNGSTIKARSIDMDDIESVLNYDPETYVNNDGSEMVNYGGQKSNAFERNKQYPAIYAEEVNSVIIPEPEGKTKSLALSHAASDWVTGSSTAGTSIRPYQTFYYLSNSNFSSKLNEEYSEVLLTSGSNTIYWVASRSVAMYTDGCDFHVRRVKNGCLDAIRMFNSHGFPDSDALSLFPVLSLNVSLISGDSTGWSVQ